MRFAQKAMKQKLLVIASYPPKGATHQAGVSSYSKNTISALPDSVQVTVLAEDLEDGHTIYKDERNVLVKRVWKKNSFLSYLKLAREAFKEKDVENVLFEFDLSSFGGMLYLIPLPLFLIGLRLLDKKVTFVFHQVILDIKEIKGHLTVSDNGFYTDLLNLLLYFFYLLTSKSVNKIIVFEEVLKKRLLRFVPEEKIAVIPHGVERFSKIPTKKEAREKLGIKKRDFVILCFGFIAWYKGTDWIIKAFNAIQKRRRSGDKITLIIAGGPNPNDLDNAYYRRYIKNVERECRENNVLLTGFVPEKKIPLYFQSADLVVAPYRTLMSASSPISMAISFKKPFLVAKNLADIFDTQDMKEVMELAKLDKEDMMFDLNEEILEKLKAILRGKRLEKKLTKLSSILREERKWDNIGKDYYEELFLRA